VKRDMSINKGIFDRGEQQDLDKRVGGEIMKF
jgi:hypothetical protein